MATELYKEEDSRVCNIGDWKLLLNSLILWIWGIGLIQRQLVTMKDNPGNSNKAVLDQEV